MNVGDIWGVKDDEPQIEKQMTNLMRAGMEIGIRSNVSVIQQYARVAQLNGYDSAGARDQIQMKIISWSWALAGQVEFFMNDLVEMDALAVGAVRAKRWLENI